MSKWMNEWATHNCPMVIQSKHTNIPHNWLTIPVDVLPMPIPGINSAVEKAAKFAGRTGKALLTACCANRESMVENKLE